MPRAIEHRAHLGADPGTVLTALARPLSATGMRRRVARLGRLAAVVDAHRSVVGALPILKT